jgi:multidrug resistance efflux pump
MRSGRLKPWQAAGRCWQARCYPAIAAVSLLCSYAQVPDLGAPVQPRHVDSFALTQSIGGGDRARVGEWPTEQWWRAHGDPQLDPLIGEALANAPSLAQAGARLREAAARSRLVNAARLPSLGLNAAAQEKKPTYKGVLPPEVLPREPTVIRDPVDGIVTPRSVDVGQKVSAATRLMSVVPVAQSHVDANFKEGQPRAVRQGQRVRPTSDLYGSDVVYHGWIDGVAGGSGSAFAAIPAPNATGNWIKVVQCLPVRIRLNPEQLAKNPLRVGLSMTVTVDLDGNPQERRGMAPDQP